MGDTDLDMEKNVMTDEFISKHDAVDMCGGYGCLAHLMSTIKPADVIPIKWIQKKIDKSIGMEHAMWSKLLSIWENEQLRKYVRNLKDDNK